MVTSKQTPRNQRGFRGYNGNNRNNRKPASARMIDGYNWTMGDEAPDLDNIVDINDNAVGMIEVVEILNIHTRQSRGGNDITVLEADVFYDLGNTTHRRTTKRTRAFIGVGVNLPEAGEQTTQAQNLLRQMMADAGDDLNKVTHVFATHKFGRMTVDGERVAYIRGELFSGEGVHLALPRVQADDEPEEGQEAPASEQDGKEAD